MTVKEAFDVLSPSCQVRVQTAKIFRSQGISPALAFLKKYLVMNDFQRQLVERLLKVNGTNWHEEVPT